MIFRGKVFVLRAKEIPGWVPEFADEFDDDDESEEGSKGYTANRHGAFNFDDADDVDKVPETELDDPLEQNENPSEDPFGIYSILNKNKDNDANIPVSDHSIKFPPGFTPNGVSMQEDIGRSVNDVTSPRIWLIGETTKFWDDIWIGSKPLKLLFPRIYALDNIKDATICMKLNEPSLDNNFRRSIRGGIEQSQFKELTDLLIPIELNPCPDRWFWSLEGSGEFSVASIRRF
ncbi:hypothetical protein Tco_0900863 [Tanacetum coccineum]